MYKCEREDEIMALLSEIEYATVDYLVQKINVSASSIRRDLKHLESCGLVTRSYGGVKLVNTGKKTLPVPAHMREKSLLKKKMAEFAAGLIRPGQTVFLDASDEAYFVAEQLAEMADVTVVTNGIDVLNFLSQYDIRVYCTGGILSQQNRAALVGDDARTFFSHMHADAAVFSVSAITKAGELWDSCPEEAAIHRAMLQRATRKILLSDSSKWGEEATFYQGAVEDIDYVICDQDPNLFFTAPTPSKYILIK